MNTFLTEISEISARSYERRRKKTPIIYKKKHLLFTDQSVNRGGVFFFFP